MSEDAKRRKEALYERIRKDVMTLALTPGGDLDETRLSAEFGLSRTPLREVFRQLAGEGYLTLRENKGARVSDMTHKTLRDFFLVAPMVYEAVMRLAAQNADPAQIQALKSAQMAFKAALRNGSTAERALANNAFHAVTGAMANNVYLSPSLERLLIDHARISMTFYRPRSAPMMENLAIACEQHDAMIESIEAGDVDGAAALALSHWSLSRGRIEMFVMPESLEAPLGEAMSTP